MNDEEDGSRTDTDDEDAPGPAAAAASSSSSSAAAASSSSASSSDNLSRLVSDLQFRARTLSQEGNQDSRLKLRARAEDLLGASKIPDGKGKALKKELKMALWEVYEKFDTSLQKDLTGALKNVDRQGAREKLASVRAAILSASDESSADGVVLRGLGGLRAALDDCVAQLLSPLSGTVLASLGRCLEDMLGRLFDTKNSLVAKQAQMSLDLLAALPLRVLLAASGAKQKLEGGVLAELFRDHVFLQMSAGASLSDALDSAVEHVLDMIVDRTEARMKEFRWLMLYSRPRKPSVMQQVALQSLRDIANLTESQEECEVQIKQLRLAVRFLSTWRKASLQLLHKQHSQQKDHEGALQQQLLTQVMRRALMLDLSSASMWSGTGAHPRSDALKHVFRWLARTLSQQLTKTVRSTTGAKLSPAAQKLVDDYRKLLLAKQPSSPSSSSAAAPSAAGQHAALQTRLQHWGLNVRDVPGDGNCLFAALCEQLKWAEKVGGIDAAQHYNAAQMRALIVEQMLVDSTSKQASEDFAQFHAGESVDAYAVRMSRDGEYGGFTEIQSFANRFQVNVQVWFGDNAHPVPFIVRSAACAHVPINQVPLINIGYVNYQGDYKKQAGGYNHYVSIEKSTQPNSNKKR